MRVNLLCGPFTIKFHHNDTILLSWEKNYTRCQKLNGPILKSFTDVTIVEKVLKFRVVFNEGIRICLI